MKILDGAGLRSYTITPRDYGAKGSRLRGMLLYFLLVTSGLLFGYWAIGRLDRGSSGAGVGSYAWFAREIPEALFVAIWMTLFARWGRAVDMTLDIEPDCITVYEGKAAHSAYRHGRTIQRSEVREIRETLALSVFGPLQRGMIVRYSRWPRWMGGAQFFVPAAMREYNEIKAQLTDWHLNRD